VKLLDTYEFGSVVILDNKIQSSEKDEFIYHEALVHPAMILHPKPQNVLILGGGEGATLREVLKHTTVEEVVMVDIDQEFVELCRKYLRKWHANSFNDQRVDLLFDEAMEYMKKARDMYDVIIADISDPVEGGPAQRVYTKKFYSLIKKALGPDGIFVTHATHVADSGTISSGIFRIINEFFPEAAFYYEYIPSFAALWAFVIGSSKYNPQTISARVINRRIKNRGLSNLSYYDAETHTRLFCIPKHIKEFL
jgi:spermidine synthase